MTIPHYTQLDNILLSIIGFLVVILLSVMSGGRKLKQLTNYTKQIYYILRFKKFRSISTDIINRQNYIRPILDEMIGRFDALHIGLSSFHNGVIDITKNHLYKLSMVDERSRYYSIIREYQSLPLSIFTDIIYGTIGDEIYELELETTDNIFLKESYSQLPLVKYVYFTTQWDKETPLFLTSIATSIKLNEEDLDKLYEYRVTIKKIIKYELESTKYDKLYE